MHKKSQKVLERERKPTYAQVTARGKVTPKEGPTNPSRSTTVMNPPFNITLPSHPLTPGPSSRRDENMAILPTPGPSTHINIKKPSHPSTSPPNLEGDPSMIPLYFYKLSID